MILTNYACCQITSPQVINYQGQVGLFIPPQQAKVINLDYIALHECKEQRDSLMPVLDSAQKLATIYERRLSNKDSIIAIRENAIDQRDNLIGVQAVAIEDKNKKIEKVTKGKNTWKVIGLSGWGAIVVAGLILLL